MLNKTKRIGTLILSLLLVFSFTACKKSDKKGTTSDDIEYVYDDEIVYVTESGETVTGPQNSDGNTSSGDTSTPTDSSTNRPSSNTSSTSKDDGVDLKKLRGTTVRYATWSDPKLNEEREVIESFEKKYGITVEIDLVGQSGYNNTIAGMVASGDSPDVYFCNMFFPSCLTTLQPIDAAKMDLTDPIWDQSMLDLFTVNGKTYLVSALGSTKNSTDCVFFNKTVLKQAGFTENQFPDKLYEKGVWTWDALETIMKTVQTKLGSQGYLGGFLAYDTMICSAGCNFYKYSNGKFSVNTSDPFLVEVNERLADWYTKGYIKGFDTVCRDEFLSGKVAIAATNAYGLKKNGYWAKMNQDSIGFTYLPDYDASHKAKKTGLTIGYGIIKGAKNPEGAGVFLRYYLDSNNYDTSDTFINDNAATFYFELTSGKGADKNLTMLWNNYTVALQQPSQVKSKLASLENGLKEDVKSLNQLIETNTK